MATYKVEVVSRLGKLHASLYEATGSKIDPTETPPHDSITDIWKALEAQIEQRGLDEETDSIIFRNIAYDDFSKLSREIRMATY